MIRFRPTLQEELRHGEEAEQAPLRSGERGRPRSRASLASPPPGARHHAGRLRGARRLPAPAPLPARAHAPGARRLRARRDALLRPAQHPLCLEHRHRRVGARQAHPLLPAHRQRRSLGVGLRLRGAPPQALLPVAPRGPRARGQPRDARRDRAQGRPLQSGREGNQGHPREGRRGEDAARSRHVRAGNAVRAAGRGPRGARRPADDARRARGEEP